MRLTLSWSAAMVFAVHICAFGQTAPQAPTPLAALIAEASSGNPQVIAAQHGARAARQALVQKTSLPDATLTLQHLSVGSPRPFAGYTNSDFAYIGLGASQELPFPGKLRLRGEVAEREAEMEQTKIEVTQVNVAEAIKKDYLQLAFLQQALSLLRRNESVLDSLIQSATIQYEAGKGMQQDVLHAQIQRTGIVRELAERRQTQQRLQAHLKGLLARDQGSPDIFAEPLTESTLTLTSTQLLDLVRLHSPQLGADQSSVRREEAQLASARREGKPDFGLSYMYQNTDRRYRDYYMLTLNVRLPRGKRVDAEIAQAAEKLMQSKATLDAGLQGELADAQAQYAQVTGDAELLKVYREGLVPQSEAAYHATLSAYGSNREQLEHVLSSFRDLVNLQLEVASTLLDHEAALAHLESLTGATLR